MLMPFLFCCSHMFHGHIKYIVRIFSYICNCHPGEKYRRRKAILCFYPKSRNLENFNLRRDKRHGIVLAMICIRLRLTAYRQGIKLCPYSSTVFQSQRFGVGQKRSLAFLYNYGHSGANDAWLLFQYEYPACCFLLSILDSEANTRLGFIYSRTSLWLHRDDFRWKWLRDKRNAA